MNLVERLEQTDAALSLAAKVLDFILEGNIPYAHRTISSMSIISHEVFVSKNRIEKMLEKSNILFAHNAAQALVDHLKKEKKAIIELIRAELASITTSKEQSP